MRVFRWLEEHFEPACIFVFVSLMTGLICVQIVARFLGYSISFAEEIARYLFIWAIYFSISYAIRDERHIRVIFFVDLLPDYWKTFSRNCADIIFTLYSLAVIYFGYIVINRSIELGQIAPATEIPVAILYMSVFIGSILNVLRLSRRLYLRAHPVRTADSF